MLVGGGPVDPSLRTRAAEAGVRVVATYGSAETCGGCVYDGLPLDGVGLALAADGRIRIAGPTLFDGYLDDEPATRAALVDGWFLTSDAGRLDEDGRLSVLGRVDDMVVSGGVNVPAAAVAARLREHPAVAAAEVVGLPDPEWGNRVVAVVSVDRPSVEPVETLSLDEARDWVAERHPRAWAPRDLVVVPALPMLDQRQGRPPRGARPGRGSGPVRVYAIAMTTRFRGITVREGALVEGAAGWGEWSPFVEYPPEEAERLAAVRRGGRRRRLAGAGARRGTRERHRARARARGRPTRWCSARGARPPRSRSPTPGSPLADDLARVEAVRDALGPSGRVRVDANGAWDVDTAVAAIGELDRAAGGLEYVEQPCASVEDLAAVRRRVSVPIAADESIRRAADPYRVRDLAAADIAVLKVQPLGGVRACLRIAEDIGMPVVVSSALETSLGLAAGVALAAALPELDHACGLATRSLLTGDVAAPELVPGRRDAAGHPARSSYPSSLDAWAAPPDRVAWWEDRLAAVRAVRKGGHP